MEIDSIVSETTENEVLSDAHGNKEISDDDEENLIMRRKKLTQKFSDYGTDEENVDEEQSPRHNSQSASKEEKIISNRKNNIMELDSIISKTTNKLVSVDHDQISEDDDDENCIIRCKMLNQNLSDHETDIDNINKSQIVDKYISPSHTSQPASSDEETITKAKPKNRIRKMSSSDNNSDSDSSNNNLKIKVRQGNRIKQKRNKMRMKFDSLLSTRNKSNECTDSKECMENGARCDSNLNSSDESNAFEKGHNQRHIFDQSIYDKDSSDDESNDISKIKKMANYKSTKMISPEPMKPARMSAKQAMENMHKIKSESNRMLREKEVSLPYHRPKAFTLKDVKNWKKPSVTKDGKALPLKMNEEQLKQYALLLEQRQKEIVELCKSDSEDDENKEEIKSTLTKNDNSKDEQECSDNLQGKENSVMAPSIINHNEDDEIVENLTKNSSLGTCLDICDDDSTFMETGDSRVTKDISENKKDNLDLNEESQNNSKTEADSMCTENITLQLSPETNICSEDSSIVVCENALPNGVINDDLQKTSMESKKGDLDDKQTFDDDDSNEMKLTLSDDDIDMDEIDKLIENADIIKGNSNSNLKLNPKISGSPGMLINLDNDEENNKPKRPSGVELLKDRFVYFAQMQTPKEQERSKEYRIKPGAQHLKLKLDLEHEIAQRRSIEWAKRLEEEKQKQLELKEIRGEISEDEDDLEKIEAKLAEEEAVDEVTEHNDIESETEEDLIEDDVDMTDKKRSHNPLVEDEAEESDVDEAENVDNTEINEGGDIDSDMESSESEDESSDEEICAESAVRKGRILKAFEDSDDEATVKISHTENSEVNNADTDRAQDNVCQDDELYSAQLHHSISEDIFTSQELTLNNCRKPIDNALEINNVENNESALNSTISDNKCLQNVNNLEDMSVIPQTNEEGNFDDVVNMCSGTFSQNLVTSSQTIPIDKETQEIGDDMLALCTGKFYDNEFVDNQISPEQGVKDNPSKGNKTDITNDNTILKSILDELDGPEYSEVKPKKFFVNDNETGKAENDQNHDDTKFKKRFVIESDDDCVEDENVVKKKVKRKRREKRALQISDDEMEEDPCDDDAELDEDHVSSDDEQNSENRIVEYDSEENEVEIQPKKKMKRKTTEFFEQEAELTSEDEWVGSGDEDEAGLDRMEREEGDNDHFHQGRLHRELEQIHMREVMDQDKREVRMIQEVLFEDADLGDGHRQRKFRWRDIDGAIENGEVNLEMVDSQEREDESEEQWRKERHERETYVRQLVKETEEKEQANLIVKTKVTTTVIVEKKNSTKDIPSPAKKPFSILQQQYRGSLLSRGSGMLTRLAALAAPLARDAADNPTGQLQPANTRNFVFAAVSPKPDAVKIIKRKADVINIGTPKLMKKMKTEEKVQTRRSIFDHLHD